MRRLYLYILQTYLVHIYILYLGFIRHRISVIGYIFFEIYMYFRDSLDGQTDARTLYDIIEFSVYSLPLIFFFDEMICNKNLSIKDNLSSLRVIATVFKCNIHCSFIAIILINLYLALTHIGVMPNLGTALEWLHYCWH